MNELTEEDCAYLADFITQTLQFNDEADPYEEDEAKYLMELRRKLMRASKGE